MEGIKKFGPKYGASGQFATSPPSTVDGPQLVQVKFELGVTSRESSRFTVDSSQMLGVNSLLVLAISPH